MRSVVAIKRKLLSTISMIGASLALGPVFVVGWIIGHLAGKFGGGKKAGVPGRVSSIVIPLGRWKLHLHHWLCSLGLISISSAYGVYLLNPHITYGILGGLAFHGIYSYSDWYKIIASRRQNRKVR